MPRPVRGDVVRPHPHSVRDLPTGRGQGKIPLNDDLFDAFLAPNEFYIDTEASDEPGSRVVSSIATAVSRAAALVGPTEEVVMRLRAGQKHVWPGPDVLDLPNDRVWMIYSVGQRNTGAVDDVDNISGSIDFQLSELAPQTVSMGLIIFRDVVLGGRLLVGEGWELSFQDGIVDEFDLTLDGTGDDYPTRLTFDHCVDPRESFTGAHPLHILAENWGVLSPSVVFSECSFVVDVTDAAGPWMELDDSDIYFVGGSVDLTISSGLVSPIEGAGASGSRVYITNTEWSITVMAASAAFIRERLSAVSVASYGSRAFLMVATGTDFTWGLPNALALGLTGALGGGLPVIDPDSVIGDADTLPVFIEGGDESSASVWSGAKAVPDPSSLRTYLHFGPGGFLNRDQNGAFYYGHGSYVYMFGVADHVAGGLTAALTLVHSPRGTAHVDYIPMADSQRVYFRAVIEAHLPTVGGGNRPGCWVVEGYAVKSGGVITIQAQSTTAVYEVDAAQDAVAAVSKGNEGIAFNVVIDAGAAAGRMLYRAAVQWLPIDALMIV